MLKALLFILCIFLSTSFYSVAQSNPLEGRVVDARGNPLPGITVVLQGTNKGSATDLKGNFTIPSLASGSYTLVISGIGFKKQLKKVQHPSDKFIYIQLEEQIEELQGVTVSANKRAQKLQSTGLNIDILDAAAYQDLNIDVNQLIAISSGVNIRESGGLGSDFELSLNGLSGNQVRYFIDGVPMEFFGSSMNLNNMTANLIKSIELYKGVVPIDLASDALGGSINIITPDAKEEFLDLSYTFGSFNTHRASAFYQKRTQNDIYFRLSSSYNYSDNN